MTRPQAHAAGSGVVLLLLLRVVPGEDLGELVGTGHDGGGVQPAGLAREPLDRARDGHGCNDPPARTPDRGRHGGDTCLALAHALGPSATANARERRGRELGAVQATVEAVRLL